MFEGMLFIVVDWNTEKDSSLRTRLFDFTRSGVSPGDLMKVSSEQSWVILLAISDGDDTQI